MQATVHLGKLRDPADIKKLQSTLEELYDLFDPLYETTAPNGSISAQRGALAIYKNGSAYSLWMNIDGDTEWWPVGMVIENRTADPSSPVTGQMWFRTDI